MKERSTEKRGGGEGREGGDIEYKRIEGIRA